MPGRLPAEFPTLRLQHAEYVAVTHRCAFEGNTALGAGAFQAEVCHQCTDNTAAKRACSVTRQPDDAQNLVAVDAFPIRINHDHAIPVAVQGDAHIGPFDAHRLLQQGRVR